MHAGCLAEEKECQQLEMLYPKYIRTKDVMIFQLKEGWEAEMTNKRLTGDQILAICKAVKQGAHRKFNGDRDSKQKGVAQKTIWMKMHEILKKNIFLQ